MLEKEATTPVQKKKLQAAIPTFRKITKPDLAKFLLTWDQKPHVASLDSQKNFQAFMDELGERESVGEDVIPDQNQFKEMIAKAILFKSAQKTASCRLSGHAGRSLHTSLFAKRDQDSSSGFGLP